MNKFLVTYDLVGTSEESADYERLIKKIKSFPTWGRIQKSVWLIGTPDAAPAVRDRLSGEIDSDDRLFVIQITPVAAWRNEICDRGWLKNFLNS